MSPVSSGVGVIFRVQKPGFTRQRDVWNRLPDYGAKYSTTQIMKLNTVQHILWSDIQYSIYYGAKYSTTQIMELNTVQHRLWS